MSEEAKAKLVKSRVRLLGSLAVLVLVLVIFNRDALWDHPDQAQQPEAPPRQAVPEDTPVSEVTFAMFDTETTGMDSATHRLVELAVVKVRNGEVLADRTWLINPERFIPEEVQEVHGISPEMVAGAPTFKEIYPSFLEFVDGCVLMAHNAQFDIKFLKQEFARAEVAQPGLVVIDSLKLFRSWFPNLSSYSLEHLAQHLKVAEAEFHRAKNDSEYIGVIFHQGIRKIGGKPTLADVYEAAGGALEL